MEIKHPKYYKELRKRNKSDQAISDEAATAATSVECGPNRQAPSMAFRDGRTADRGSLHSHKVLCVHDRRPGL